MTVIDSAPRHSAPVTSGDAGEWITALALSALTPGRGVAVLLPSGAQVALFRTGDAELFAVSNIDPFGRAAVMSRGLVGDRGGEPTVASPLLKQVFSLVDGRCLDDPDTTLAVHEVTVIDGVVAVSTQPSGASVRPRSGTETTSP
ncbi:nitrite reductase small subunit NirD [Rhodococcus sp. BP-349]|uniref:nitrite reductase small subunit NirD n=1 Tax=unclassified Rhodococcus (in: high G+C Gram-positive bacteria) TaxID=192944 RepID=UPI001C9AE566|nr:MULTISPECIES: nitrite reductase small subunit NirD [unclassified Rhodococcus (in: high G+C Gram-positive bacteria)]MBY6538966.1 nitrite reductase small subunit NirD [Rhodococcus sp. BP-363]MBY6543303.1 nitrite reductase small subunit NirD [Rhodococcus sp. BP-369]MBY6562533.1 nitrite reductase small subunit NirD [Rhodococcus sp. BP-370]MBY6576825.1 nitrite reductase small subunit NirD [Rhodococcus sp. BP-364]MBY6586126.1 nitrite reductase small subunit NirD [Rhodococcus sp. BP-358]